MAVPKLVIGVDPDSVRTAVAFGKLTGRRSARRFDLVGLEGGGSSRVKVRWSSVTGIMPWLREVAHVHGCSLAEVVVVIETQAANGPRSADVESLRRVRYHFDAACELLETQPIVHVDKAAWQQVFVPVAMRTGGGKDVIKEAYQARARELTAEADNEDKCAALGVLDYYIRKTLRGSLTCK